MGFIEQIGSSLASGLSGVIGGLPSAGVNMLLNTIGMKQQKDAAKDMMDYQWKNFQSPQAQVNALAAAGINPAVALGQGGTGAFASPSPSMPSSVPVAVDGVANMLSSLTQLKKVDKENELVDQEIYKTLAEKGLIDEQRHGQAIANTIAFQYGDKEAAAKVANLGAQAALAASQKDNVEAEKLLVDLKRDTEKIYQGLLKQNKLKAALEVKNYQRYIDSLVNSNNASAEASRASATASSASAELTTSQKDYQELINNLERATSHAKRMNLLNRLATSDVLSEEAKKKSRIMINRYNWLIKEKENTKAGDYFDYMLWYWKNETPDIDFDVPLAIPIK